MSFNIVRCHFQTTNENCIGWSSDPRPSDENEMDESREKKIKYKAINNKWKIQEIALKPKRETTTKRKIASKNSSKWRERKKTKHIEMRALSTVAGGLFTDNSRGKESWNKRSEEWKKQKLEFSIDKDTMHRFWSSFFLLNGHAYCIHLVRCWHKFSLCHFTMALTYHIFSSRFLSQLRSFCKQMMD